MALTKVTGQVINDTTGLVVGVTTVGGGLSATDGFFSGIVTAVGDASFSGNVSVGGTLTYEDVTNIDAVGLVTARNGIVVGSGITLSKDGDIFATGITTISENLKVGTGVTISPDGDGFFTGVVTATTFSGAHSGSGANLTSLPAAQLTGALPAISGANLTGIAATDNVRTGILDVAGIATFRSDVNVPNINGGQIGGRRNLLINGAMRVNQRVQTGTLGYFNPVTGSIYTLDRWKVLNANSFDTDSAQVTQDSSGPDGFRNSIMMNIGNTETPSSNQVCGFQQKIEAQDCQGLKFGTSSAETTTLSFWVYSNKTGTYCIQVIHEDVSKYVLFEYTINASNTWEKKTITISGNTSNSITDDNGTGLNVIWVLCAGSGRHVSATSSWTSSGNALATSNQVNLWDNADNYFRMTGCQLEIGTTATEFENRRFQDELQDCMRYYERQSVSDGNGGYATVAMGHRVNNTRVIIQPNFRVIKRATNATFEFNGPMRILYQNNGAEQTISSWSAVQNRQFGLHGGYIVLDQSSGVGGSDGYTFRLEGNGNTGSYIAFESEL